MTLGASHVGSEKDVEGVGQVVERHARIPKQVTGRARTGNGPLRREHIVNHLVPGTIFGDLILEPPFVVTVVGSPDGMLVAQKIGQPIEQVRSVAIRKKELVDQLPAFFRILVLEKGRCFVVGRNTTYGIQIDSRRKTKSSEGGFGFWPALFNATPT